MNIREVSPEVYQAEGPAVWASRENIEFLKQRARESPRGRARLCAHPGPEDAVHEMLIALSRATAIRPHIHPGNVESVHVIEGEMDAYLFTEQGEILETVRLGAFPTGKPFYYRMTVPLYHTWVPLTELVVVQEVTRGPFRRDNMVPAPWAPPEGPDGKLRAYLDGLRA